MFERWLKPSLENLLLIDNIDGLHAEKPARRDIRHLRGFMDSIPSKDVRASVLYLGMEYLEIAGVRFIPIYALYRAG